MKCNQGFRHHWVFVFAVLLCLAAFVHFECWSSFAQSLSASEDLSLHNDPSVVSVKDASPRQDKHIAYVMSHDGDTEERKKVADVLCYISFLNDHTIGNRSRPP